MNVTLYATPTCPYCHMARDFLKNKGIPFKDMDVSSDPKVANEMIKLSGQMGVPVIVVDGEVIIGFDQPEIERALAGKSKGGPASDVYR